ncbi:MAG: hypothetical protein ACP5QS_01915 [bacterium]
MSKVSSFVIARASEGNPPQSETRLLRRFAPRNDGNTPSGCRLPPLSMKGELKSEGADIQPQIPLLLKRGAERSEAGYFLEMLYSLQ